MGTRLRAQVLAQNCVGVGIADPLQKLSFAQRTLWGPQDGLGAQMPPILSSIQCLGAFKRFKCFLGPRTWKQQQGARSAT